MTSQFLIRGYPPEQNNVEIVKEDNMSIPSNSSDRDTNFKKKNSEHGRIRRKRRRKKTPVWCFRCKLRRGRKKPDLVTDLPPSRYVPVRYGLFKKFKDIRSEFCPYRNIKHQIMVKPNLKCSCQHRSLCPTTLCFVTYNNHMVVKNFEKLCTISTAQRTLT